MSSHMSILDRLLSKLTFGDKNNDNSYVSPFYCPDCCFIWESFDNYLKHLKYCRSEYISIFAENKGVIRFIPDSGKEEVPIGRCNGKNNNVQFCLKKLRNYCKNPHNFKYSELNNLYFSASLTKSAPSSKKCLIPLPKALPLSVCLSIA